MKHLVTKGTARQLYFAFVYSKIAYGLEVYGNCSQHNLQKIQTIQSRLLKLLLSKDPRTPTNELHRYMNILKVKDIQNTNIICFVRNCLSHNCPDQFFDYFIRRVSPYAIRNCGLNVIPHNTHLGSLAIRIIGAKLWNNLPRYIQEKLNQLNFRKITCQYYINQYE